MRPISYIISSLPYACKLNASENNVIISLDNNIEAWPSSSENRPRREPQKPIISEKQYLLAAAAVGGGETRSNISNKHACAMTCLALACACGAVRKTKPVSARITTDARRQRAMRWCLVYAHRL